MVKYHSILKHRLLGGYLSVCANYVKSAKYRPFIVVDLFAGKGKAVCEEVDEEWEGSSQIISKWVSRCGENAYCILNEMEKNFINDLRRNTEQYKKNIKKIYNADANKIHRKILKKHIPIESHSIFFLDPYSHPQLSFCTVKEIAEHCQKDEYRGDEFVRRPELILNFPVYTILTSITQNKDLITQYMGTDKWIEEVEQAKKRGESQEMALLNTYEQQLRKYYGKNGVVPIRIESLRKKSPVYYLIFASTHPLASSIYSNFDRWMDKQKREFRKKGFKLLNIKKSQRTTTKAIG